MSLCTLVIYYSPTFFDLMLDTTAEHEYLVRNAQTMSHILNGELGQMAERFNLEQTFTDYLNDIKGKTAAPLPFSS